MKITIDGKEIEAKEGQSVLEAALAADIFIPISATIRTLKPREAAACAPWKSKAAAGRSRHVKPWQRKA